MMPEEIKVKCGLTWFPDNGESDVTVKNHACALEVNHSGNHKCKFRNCCEWPREEWEKLGKTA